MFEPNKANPTEVVEEVWRLLEAEDYDGAAVLHTEGFAGYAAKNALREAEPRWSKPRTTEQMLEFEPDMPAEVAEWQAAQYRKQPPPTPYFGSVFGVRSSAELEALNPAQVLSRRLQAADWRTRWRPHLDELSRQYPQYLEQLEQQRREACSQWGGEVAGHVVSGQRAYVIVEKHAGPLEDTPADWGPVVVTLRCSDTGWKISSDLTDGATAVHFHIEVKDEDGKAVVLS